VLDGVGIHCLEMHDSVLEADGSMVENAATVILNVSMIQSSMSR
jgi:hypothetical protein